MNKLLQGIFLSSFALLIFACKKDKDQVYDVVLNMNGNTVLLHNATCRLGPDTLNPAIAKFRLTAATYDSSKAFTVDIWKDDLNLVAGAYTSGSAGFTVMVDYFENINIPAIKDFGIANAPGKPASQYTVTITEVSSGFVRGTITGNYLTEKFSASNATVEISEASFYALRVY